MVKAGYKQTEIGVIPEDWKLQSIRDIATVKTGPFGTLLKASEYTDVDGVPLISVGEIQEGFLRISEHTPRIPENVTHRLPQYLLRSGDIVFGRKGGVERSALIRPHQEGWFLGSDGMSVRPMKQLCSAYLATQFQGERVKTWLLQHAIGTTMASLNQEILQRTVIPIPPTNEEQQAIAETLSDADELIDKKRAIKTAAMQQLLTGKQRLPGFSGEWETKQLGDIASFFKGKGLPKSALSISGKYPCIHYGELFTRYPETIGEILSHTDDCTGAFLSVVNDVLMPTSDVTPRGLAKASCVKVDGVILGGDILIIRSDIKLIDGSFLSYLIRYEEAQILQLVTGSTVFHLYGSDMAKFDFEMPSLPEQQAIAGVLSDMDAEIQALEARLEKTKAIKQGMMQQLLTGKVRLV